MMNNKSKTFSTISIIILAIEALIGLCLKTSLFIKLNVDSETLLWAIGLMSLTLLPYILLIIDNFILIKKECEKRGLFLAILLVVIAFVILCIAILVELLSILGAAMSLNGYLADMAICTLILHFIAIIPIVFTIISMVARRKMQ